MKTLFFPYYRRLPGNGKQIWNVSFTLSILCRFSGRVNLMDDLPLLRPAHMAYVDGMNDDVVWCIKSMTDPSVCVIAQPERPTCLSPPHIVMTSCHDPSRQRQPVPPPRPPASDSGGQSDTLETRTKLTSHSALECGGLPQLPVPIHTSREPETPAGLNSRLEAVSGA